MKDKFALLEEGGGIWLGAFDSADGGYRCVVNWSGEWQEPGTTSWSEDYLRIVSEANSELTLTLIDEDHPRFGEICAMIMKKELLG